MRSAVERRVSANKDASQRLTAAFLDSNRSSLATTNQNLALQESLLQIKLRCRNLERDLSKAHSVKTSKEVKQKTTLESLFNARRASAEHDKLLQVLRETKNNRAALISQQLREVTDAKKNKDGIDKEDSAAAISWFYEVLGFRIEAGEGVKFIFDKIDWRDAEKQYSFTIQLEDDTYRLLQCDPMLEDITELTKELNENQDFYKYVTEMRKKFKMAAQQGTFPAAQDTSNYSSAAICLSHPPISKDTISGSPITDSSREIQNEKEHHQSLPLSMRHKSDVSPTKYLQLMTVPHKSPKLHHQFSSASKSAQHKSLLGNDHVELHSRSMKRKKSNSHLKSVQPMSVTRRSPRFLQLSDLQGK